MRKPPKFRSKFEQSFFKSLPADSVEYESVKLKYVIPASNHTYTPDFHITGTNIYLETKGWFSVQDRAKHLLIKEQHPDKRIIMVFMKANCPIRKGSKTTVSAWAEKNGLEWMTVQEAQELVKQSIVQCS